VLAFLISLHMLIALVLIGLVLIQRGRGADIGAAFGSGASQTVFGARGSGSFLSRMTAVLAALFFLSSLGLAYVYSKRSQRASVTQIQEPAAPSAPAEEGGQPPAQQRDVPQVPGVPAAPNDRPPP
jgi:preprotein translocase subunit SecG